jgi:hypothetical protein
MSNTVSAQHPTGVLRAANPHLRTLLAIAAIAIAGLTAAVVVLALNGSSTASPAPHRSPAAIVSYPGHF